MNQKKTNIEMIKSRIPTIGILLFIVFYIYSSTLYPGGSQLNSNSEGFDWINNYWCNLMSEKGMNEQINPARPCAISAMIILCLSLMFFFIQFANTFPKSRFWKRLIIVNGVLSMIFAILIFTKYHDLMTIISSIFGLFVVIGIIKEVYKSELMIYKISGVICILLLGINNYIYYTQQFIEGLPLIQKVTFAFILIWIIGLNYELMKKKKEKLATTMYMKS
jgi:hypothetical protein